MVALGPWSTSCDCRWRDVEVEASVEQMQKVIELARTIRERKGRPLKQPLRQLTVVHPDPAVAVRAGGGAGRVRVPGDQRAGDAHL